MKMKPTILSGYRTLVAVAPPRGKNPRPPPLVMSENSHIVAKRMPATVPPAVKGGPIQRPAAPALSVRYPDLKR